MESIYRGDYLQVHYMVSIKTKINLVLGYFKKPSAPNTRDRQKNGEVDDDLLQDIQPCKYY